MPIVRTFLRRFPAYHLKAGQETYFREKIWAGMAELFYHEYKIPKHITDWDWHEYYNAIPKYTTIRAGEHLKAGDWFSPREWSGTPYNSKQTVISDHIQVKRTYRFDMKPKAFYDECIYYIDGKQIGTNTIREVALNDGLTPMDFIVWFAGPNMLDSKRKPFNGQIIIWNEKIKY